MSSESNQAFTTGQNAFVPVSHPELRRLGRKNVRTFLKERECYLLRVKDAQNSGSNVLPVSLVSSVDRDLLLSTIPLGVFGSSVQEIDDLTDEILEKWLEDKDSVALESISLEELEGAVNSSVRINVNEPDAEMRIISLFSDYRTLLRNKKWERLIDDSPKTAIEHVTRLLKPDVLRQRIESDLALNINHIEDDWARFYSRVLKRAIDCEEYIPIRTTLKANDTQSSNTQIGRKGKWRKRRGATCDDAVRNIQSPSKEIAPTASNTTPRMSMAVDKASLPTCLNPSCNDRHYLKNCPKTSASQRLKLIADYRAKRSQNEASPKRMNLLSQETVMPMVAETDNSAIFAESPDKLQPGRYQGKLAGVTDVIVNGDYGSDHAALCDAHLQDLAKKKVFVQVLPLSSPIWMGVAVDPTKDDDSPVRYAAHKKARISITIDTPSGPLKLRNVQFLVFNEHMSEVLLSRPLLQAIGFDLDKHFATVRNRFNGVDFSHIGFSQELKGSDNETEPIAPSRLSRLLLDKSEQTKLQSVDDRAEHTEDVVAADIPTDMDVPSPFFYGDVPDDDPIPAYDPIVTGSNCNAETKKHLESMLHEAVENGLENDAAAELSSLLMEYIDIFRTKIGCDPPANIPPMEISLVSHAKPVRVKVRRYSPPQAAFLRKKVEELLSMGLIRANNRSAWACAPLIVPKAGPEEFRFTVDLRPVNSQTIPHAWPMPDLESMTSQLTRDTCYATLDLCQGYWQMALHENSQECQSFITPDGVFSPTRVLHGATNAVSYFQSSLQAVCIPVRDKLLRWIDDILIYCTSTRDLLDTLRKVFELFRTHGLKLHAKKCRFYL